MPSIPKASSEFGTAPKDFQPLRWLPVDVAATLLYAFIQDAKTNPDVRMTYYSLENAQPMNWSRITSAPGRVDLTYTQGWDDSNDRAAEFYLNTKRLPVLDTTNARKAAGELTSFELTDETLDLYIVYACGDS
ncbi:hypothetical protein D9756_005767 [Leucocoprinus leucothites]|uniref:Uncharacterized protein n=1 Tax=Leucocoprinus leucothites TaxID=201217 RepID=A0A8H5FZC5_9AGAR|nr:hypothetical protein D9756_005767 [Leucoagaricus leucothites]